MSPFFSARAVAVLAAGCAVLGFGPRTPAADDLTGKWEATFESGGRSTGYNLHLEQKGSDVAGVLVSPRTNSNYPIDGGSIKDGRLRFSVPKKGWTIEAALAGDRLEGTYTAAAASGKFAAKRAEGPAVAEGQAPSLPGRWTMKATLPDGREVKGWLEVAEKDGKLTGKIGSDRGALDLQSVAIAGGKFTAKVAMVTSDEGEKLDIRLEGTLEGTEAMKGTWTTADGSMRGEFSAKKEAPAARRGGRIAARYLVQATIPDGQTVRLVIEPKVEGDKLTGTILFGGQKIEIRNGTVRPEGRIDFEADIPYQGQTRTVKLTGTQAERGVINGTWSTDDGSGDWTARPMADL